MHRPRRKRTPTEAPGCADRLADWLLSHCPFCTLTILLAVVLGPTIGPIPEPLFIAVPVVIADAAFFLMRRLVASPPPSVGAK